MRAPTVVRRMALIAAPAALALVAAITWMAQRDRSEQRPATEIAMPAAPMESRIADLKARTQVPGSILACLNTSLGDVVDAGCERSIFANPETIAAASAFAADRLSVLADSQNSAGARSPQVERALDGLRRAVEQDRFGLVANMLAVQEGCTADRCDHLAMLRDPTRIQDHLQQRTFDTIVARHAGGWSSQLARALPPTPSEATASAQPSPKPVPTGKPLPADYVLPSSESIPAISIMNNEPAREKLRAAADLDASSTTKPSSRRERSAQARPGTPDTVGVPLSLSQ